MMIIPERLAATCRGTPERRAWLAQLPGAIRAVQDRWALVLEAPFDGNEVSCSWVAPAVRRDGTRAILKLGMPHMEAEHELQALRFWDGDPAVRLLAAMTAQWASETLADAARWPDAGLVEEGLRLFEELPRTSPTEVLLAPDLHAGNVLRAQRAPWLVIDP